MKHLVIGASGQVGKALRHKLLDRGDVVVGTHLHHAEPGLASLDMTQADAVDRLMTAETPDVVWLPAALTNVDLCETDRDLSFQINVRGTQNVGRAAARVGARLVFFSTDYVFDGVQGPFKESDITRPVQVYGRHKVEAEDYLLGLNLPLLIVRPAWIYSADTSPRNFVFRIVEQLRKRTPVKAAIDQYSTPTPTEGLVNKVMEAVARGHEGILHLAGTERLNRYELTEKIAEMSGLSHEAVIEPIQTHTLNLPAARPLNGGLVTAFDEYRLTDYPLSRIRHYFA